MAHDVSPGIEINTYLDMDNDLSNNTYDEQRPTRVPPLLKLFFPGSARELQGLAQAKEQAQAAQRELDMALRNITDSSRTVHASAKKITMAARQASSRAANEREKSIFKQLQLIDPSFTCIDAVREKIEACAATPHEEPAADLDSIEIEIDGISPAAAVIPDESSKFQQSIADDAAGFTAIDGQIKKEEDEAKESANKMLDFDAEAERQERMAEQLAAVEAEHLRTLDSLRAEHEKEIDGIQARHKDEIQKLIAEYESRIESMHLDTEKILDRLTAEKEAAAMAWKAEKNDLEARANEHSEELEEKDNALKLYYGAFSQMFDAFMDRVMAVRDAYTGNDPECPVAKAISEKIMANDSYGLDDFIVDLRASMEASSADPASLREKVRTAFLECLQTSSANWLNVLARFYAYGQVPFCRKALEDGGLDMPLIDRAFVSLEDILAYGGIDLCRPNLFGEDFNPELHVNQPIRNIDSYVNDIAAHAGPDTIVDIYLVGYDDGVTQRKPVVSKMA